MRIEKDDFSFRCECGHRNCVRQRKAQIINSYIKKASKIITSDLYKAETANVLYKYLKAGFLDKDSAIEKLTLCQLLIDEFYDIDTNKEEALLESVRLKHSVYDLLYFTLARRNGAWLITLDKKLKRIAKEGGVDCLEIDS